MNLKSFILETINKLSRRGNWKRVMGLWRRLSFGICAVFWFTGGLGAVYAELQVLALDEVKLILG